MVGCKRGCLHRTDVRDSRVAREAAEVTREAITGGHATELEQYPPIIDYKTWLTSKRGGREDAA